MGLGRLGAACFHTLELADYRRCLFWLDFGWMEVRSCSQNLPLIDPCRHGLDRRGLDKEGHLRVGAFRLPSWTYLITSDKLNDRCCPICQHERQIIQDSPTTQWEDSLMENFDRVLDSVSTKLGCSLV